MKSIIAVLGCLLITLSEAGAQDGWKQIYPEPVRLYHAVSADTVYVVADFDLMFSSNAGNSWSKIGAIPRLVDTAYGSGHLTYNFYDLHVSSDDDMLLSASKRFGQYPGWGDINGSIYVTTDGGINWESRKSSVDGPWGSAPVTKFFGLPNSEIFGFGPSTPNNSEVDVMLPPVYCFWRDDSLDVGNLRDSHYMATDATVAGTFIFLINRDTLYRNDINWGAWQPIMPVTGEIVSFDLRTLVVGNMRTSDNGETWNSANTPGGQLFGSSVGVGWAVGDELYKSVDAGQSWRRIDHAPRLWDITTIDSSVAYARGADGTLYRTVTGGWKLSVPPSRSPVGLQIYPNPALDAVFASQPLKWFDALGRSYAIPFVIDGDTYRYDVTGLNAGIYLTKGDQSACTVVIR